MTLKRSLVPILTLVLIANLSCVQRREERNAQQQDVAVPARVVETIARKITEYAELPGRSAAAESVEVRAQVSGYLESFIAPFSRSVRATSTRNAPISIVSKRNSSVSKVSLKKARPPCNSSNSRRRGATNAPRS